MIRSRRCPAHSLARTCSMLRVLSYPFSEAYIPVMQMWLLETLPLMSWSGAGVCVLGLPTSVVGPLDAVLAVTEGAGCTAFWYPAGKEET